MISWAFIAYIVIKAAVTDFHSTMELLATCIKAYKEFIINVLKTLKGDIYYTFKIT